MEPSSFASGFDCDGERESQMRAHSLFRITTASGKEMVCTWDETLKVIESGNWLCITDITKDYLSEGDKEPCAS
jgi:hypothetical protein